MSRLLIISIVFLWTGSLTMFAQWTSKDSLWLSGSLSGNDTIRLNPETMESIRQGTFLNWDRPQQAPLGSSTLELPITKDFDAYFQEQDTVGRRFNLTELPPHIILRHYNPKVPPHILMSDDYLYLPVKRSTEGIRTVGYDFVHGLNMAFSPEYRRFMRNQKNAENLKFYNSLPSPELRKKQQHFLSNHPERALPKKGDEKKTADLPLPHVRIATKDSLSTNQSSSLPDSVSVESPEDPAGYKTLPN